MAYTDLTVEEYKARFVDGGEQHTLVDVREVDEYEEGHVPGAINLPLSELEGRLGELPAEGNLLLICKTGGRSAMAAAVVGATGRPNLFNVDGGTMGWAKAGNPLEV